MTSDEKDKIKVLRSIGMSYSKIASRLDISVNSIKSYCKRNGIDSFPNVHELDMDSSITPSPDEEPISGIEITTYLSKEEYENCKYCGEKLAQIPKRKNKIFCSDKCRMAWWHNQKNPLEKNVSHFRCLHCGSKFEVYGSNNRKFCNHQCYINYRFYSVIKSIRE